jgi:uncharacterized protein
VGETALFVPLAPLVAQVRTLNQSLAIDWMSRAFTRCSVDNTPLRDVEAYEIDHPLISSGVVPGPYLICDACRRVYWRGSHYDRVNGELTRFQGIGRE